MADRSTEPIASARDWLAEHVAEDPPPSRAARPDPPTSGASDADHAGDSDTGELACAANTAADIESASPHSAGPDPGVANVNAAAKRVRRLLCVGVAGTAGCIAAVLAIFGGGPPPTPHPSHRAVTPIVATPPSSPSLPVQQQDQAVPFSATTTSCTPTAASGQQSVARSPQALSDAVGDSAWVCGRGPQESLLDGQVLHVQFTCSATQPQSACSYILASLAVTPGWVAKTPTGKDEWLQHRVVRTLQFNFFNGSQLAADPFFVDTHDVHGPVTAPLPAAVLASRVDILVLHTERPPAGPVPAANPDAATGGPDRVAATVLGQPPELPGPDTSAEPSPEIGSAAVDATFAISELQMFGHSPS